MASMARSNRCSRCSRSWLNRLASIRADAALAQAPQLISLPGEGVESLGQLGIGADRGGDLMSQRRAGVVEQLGRGPVQPGPAGRRDVLVDRGLHQRVRERHVPDIDLVGDPEQA